MGTMQRGDVIVTAFPFAEGYMSKVRPAVVCGGPWNADYISVCWIVMITSSLRHHWPGDVRIESAAAAGLPKTSLIRTLKVACIDTRNVVKTIGSLDRKTLKAMHRAILQHVT
ncbi:type II toxin-antitoxin system PemK/MazF family toxin [Candidatus Kaiserbacteria bacterium]|nr:type II toxin-antitoxin system PemK/MazF family toxin [Candidatus Kaiserbacteria bacterium]